MVDDMKAAETFRLDGLVALITGASSGLGCSALN
jgi:NADP-dependent 3-hydroxy acid dehydrogenase YdfG